MTFNMFFTLIGVDLLRRCRYLHMRFGVCPRMVVIEVPLVA